MNRGGLLEGIKSIMKERKSYRVGLGWGCVVWLEGNRQREFKIEIENEKGESASASAKG